MSLVFEKIENKIFFDDSDYRDFYGRVIEIGFWIKPSFKNVKLSIRSLRDEIKFLVVE